MDRHDLHGTTQRAAVTLLAFVFTTTGGLAPSDAGGSQKAISPGMGSIEFTATTQADARSFLKPQTILSATAGDGSERLEAKIAGEDLIVIRDVRPCLRLAARLQNAVKPAVAQQIALRWNGASAAVAIDRGQEQPLEPLVADAFHDFPRSVLAIGSRDVTTRRVAFDRLPRLVESPADREFAARSQCFDPAQAAQGRAQETYRGIGLRGFADSARLAGIKSWIDGMTPAMQAAVQNITVTQEGAPGWRGLSVPDAKRVMLLRPEALTKPATFYHEAAHLLDSAHAWHDSQAWGERFMGLPAGTRSFSPGAVGHMDASAPGEQLADFSGNAHSEVLGFASTHLCASDDRCAGKADFLAARGYLSTGEAKALAMQTTPLVGPAAVHAVTGPGDAASGSAPATRVPVPPAENPVYQTETIVPPPGASTIEIVLDPRHFRPIDIYHDGGRVVSPTWRGCKAEDVMNRLSHKRPAAITGEPPLRGASRRYGYFDFGTTNPRRHYFALDDLPGGGIEMRFDTNRNGRLDDDGPARTDRGRFENGGKGYATLIELPWAEVMGDPRWDGTDKLWFMSNPFEWSINGFSKSNHSQLIGAVTLDGETFDLIVADSAESDNDGDYRNDGLCLRKAGGKAQCYKDKEARKGVLVDGKQYVFDVRYP